MSNRSQKKTYMLIAVLTGMVISLGIAFAALSTTLKVNFGKVTQTAQSWNVGFIAATNVAATESKTSTTGYSCGKATVTASTVTVGDTQLSKPGDKCTWTVQVKNSGTINAYLSSIAPTKPGSATCGTATGGNLVCGNITYKLTTDSAGNTLYAQNAGLNAAATQTLYVVAMYNSNSLSSTAVEQSGAAFSLVYSQK